MPRKSRIDAPGALHHIIARGIERKSIFRDNKDRNSLLERLSDIIAGSETKCFAWSLMQNHFHLLLKTGTTSISHIMRRLLTGYAVNFNRRHRRYGHLFQNRYKSILCQEDSYLMELVRYIHLNHLRAGIVKGLRELDKYPYCGHSAILGKQKNDWQDIEYVLGFFDENISTARRQYRLFVHKGISQGRRPDLIGGGLIRSYGGWSGVLALRKAKSYQKGDERILGDGEFVEQVLASAEENLDRIYYLKAKGFELEDVLNRVADLMHMEPEEVMASGKHQRTVCARSLLCYWASSELEISQTFLAEKLKISQPAVSLAVNRGKEIAKINHYSLIEK